MGLASALIIWSAGSEPLPVCLLVLCLAVYELGWGAADEACMGFWRYWWVSGFLGTLFAWLFEFWPHVFHGRLEFISVWSVVLWATVGGLLELVRRSHISRRLKLLAVAAAVGVAGVPE